MIRLLFDRQMLFLITAVGLLAMFAVPPVCALEQSAKPRILAFNIDKISGHLITCTLKTSGRLYLPKYPFILTKPNRIVLDFYGALPGRQLETTCRGASTQQMTIRSGRHVNYTRIVLDFGDHKVPNHQLSQKLGFVTLTLAFPHSPSIRPEGTDHADLEDAPTAPDDRAQSTVGESETDFLAQQTDIEAGVADADTFLDDTFDLPGEDQASHGAFSFSGSLQNTYYRDTKEDDAFESDALNHFETLAKLSYDPGGTFRAELGVDADAYAYDNDGDFDYDNDVRFYETYINLSFSGLNLRLGNQIVRWGKSDGYSPLDNVNPEDLRSGVAGRREARKTPIPMANIEYDLQGTVFQGIYIPGFYKSDFDLVGTDWSLFGHADQSVGAFDYQEEDHGDLFDSPEYGLRISSTVRNLDFALSYLHTRTDTPVIGSLSVPLGYPLDLQNAGIRDLVAFAIATSQPISIKYERQNIYGLAFETTIADFGLRGDVAYFEEANYLTEALDQIQKPLLQYVLGVDYVSPSNFYINLQFSHAMILDYENTIVFQEENVYALNGTISQAFINGEYKLQLRGYYDLSGDASMYNPQIIIKPWDSFSLELGAEIFSGTRQTLLGLFEDNDQYYGRFRFVF